MQKCVHVPCIYVSHSANTCLYTAVPPLRVTDRGKGASQLKLLQNGPKYWTRQVLLWCLWEPRTWVQPLTVLGLMPPLSLSSLKNYCPDPTGHARPGQ